jgi:hypothetical protein
MAELHEDSFDVFPLREDYHCTPQSVASYTLYENADPFELKEPSGTLRTDKACYEARRRSHRQSRLRPNRVRNGLSAGGDWIRTFSSARDR